METLWQKTHLKKKNNNNSQFINSATVGMSEQQEIINNGMR